MGLPAGGNGRRTSPLLRLGTWLTVTVRADRRSAILGL